MTPSLAYFAALYALDCQIVLLLDWQIYRWFIDLLIDWLIDWLSLCISSVGLQISDVIGLLQRMLTLSNLFHRQEYQWLPQTRWILTPNSKRTLITWWKSLQLKRVRSCSLRLIWTHGDWVRRLTILTSFSFSDPLAPGFLPIDETQNLAGNKS